MPIQPVCAMVRVPVSPRYRPPWDNAGPTPATVHLFPGVYAESVDLSTMGSAIRGSVGDLTLQTVDATGLPTVGGVLINPDAAGGPGAGSAIRALTPTFEALPMSLSLYGFVATSPDTIAVMAFIDGNGNLSDLEFNVSGDGGLAFMARGSVTANRMSATLNQGHGLSLLAGESLTLDSLTAFRNDFIGLNLASYGGLTASNISSTFNDSGIRITACDSADLDTLTASSNTGIGFGLQQLEPDSPECDTLSPTFQEALRAPRQSPSWPSTSDFLRQMESAKHAPRLGSPLVQITNATSNNNGDRGIVLFAFAGVAQLSNITAQDNASTGAVFAASEVNLFAGLFERNTSGAFIGAELVNISDSQAADNLGGSSDTGDGSGFLVAGSSGDLIGLEAIGNLQAGLVLGFFGDEPSLITVEGGLFENNRLGITTLEVPELNLSIRGAIARSNEVGIAIPFAHNLVIREARLDGNILGLETGVVSRLSGRLLDFIGNGKGAEVDLPAGVPGSIRCSNFIDSAVAGVGLHLLSDSQLDGRNNFWNSLDGPNHPNNPGGSGEFIFDSANGGAGTVDFQNFLESSATEADCLGSPLEVPVDRPVLILLALLLGVLGLVRIRLG